jgi:hypothetical protein
MKYSTKIITAVAAACALAIGNAQATLRTDVVKVYGHLTEAKPEGDTSQGTGFFVTKKSLITAYHVVKNCDRIIIRWIDGRTSEATIERSNPACDVAALLVSSPRTDQAVAHVVLDSNLVSTGTYVHIDGYPNDSDVGASAFGHLDCVLRDSSKHPIAWASNMVLKNVDRGSSGSPVFNAQWQVVGMADAMFDAPNKPRWIYILTANVFNEALNCGYYGGVTDGLDVNTFDFTHADVWFNGWKD